MLPVPLRGVMAGITVGLLLIVAAADVRADPPPTTTTDVTTSTQPTTTTTTPATTSSTTTTAATTTAPVTTVPATTAPPTTRAIETAPARATATLRAFGPSCAVAAVALIRPRGAPFAIGPIASSSLSYPANGSTVTAASVDIEAGGCGRGLARLESLSCSAKRSPPQGSRCGSAPDDRSRSLRYAFLAGRRPQSPASAFPSAAGDTSSSIRRRVRLLCTCSNLAPGCKQAR